MTPEEARALPPGVRLECSVCRVRVRVDRGNGRETFGKPAQEHQHRKPYRLWELDFTPDKYDWHPGRTR